MFPYNRIVTSIQFLNFVYHVFNFELFSIVIKRALDVTRAVLPVMTIPTLGFNIDYTGDVFAEPDPLRNSMTIRSIFYSFKFPWFCHNIQFQF